MVHFFYKSSVVKSQVRVTDIARKSNGTPRTVTTLSVNLLHSRFGVDNFNILEGLSF